MDITVIIPTHNPRAETLARVLASLAAQTLPPAETLLIDNASAPPLDPAALAPLLPRLRVLSEPALGLTSARRRGLREARTALVVFADDDNLLAPDYLAQTRAAFARLPGVGALGGKSLPEFAVPPPPWADEFFSLLALRDLGDAELLSHGLRPPGSSRNAYPLFAPIGAGMALRREAALPWLAADTAHPDRRGAELTSSGDNDIILSLMKAGWDVAYVPALRLTHLIPAARLDPGYLARLNHGIQKSWTRLLLAHDASPWPPLPRRTLPLRKAKAWFAHRAWSQPAGYIRWRGACGHFEGRATPPPAP